MRVDHVLDESAMRSREGKRIQHAAVSMAMPSSTAMVLNSFATTARRLDLARYQLAHVLQVHVPGTNWVNELAIAMIGLLKSPSFMPVARHSARAPAMLRPRW